MNQSSLRVATVPVIGPKEFVINKRASGRIKDLMDIALLEEMCATGRRPRESRACAMPSSERLLFPQGWRQGYPLAVRIALSLLLALPLLALLVACGPKLPPRYVLEKDLGPYKFRRYQQVLDVEIGIEGNEAVGHTATYVRGGKTVLVSPVFITVYQHAAGLTETVRQRLRSMQGYSFDIVELHGENLFRMRGAGEGGDSWLLWVSGPQLVKLGAPEGQADVPDELLEPYLEKYPSDLDDKGKAKSGAASAGAAVEFQASAPAQPEAAAAGAEPVPNAPASKR